MAKNVIMPALGMAQETGQLVRWLKAEGDQVAKGEPLAEVMTDKAMVELEAPADGILAGVAAGEGEDVPVGRVIALLLAPGETLEPPATSDAGRAMPVVEKPAASGNGLHASSLDAVEPRDVPAAASASPLAARIAAEHHLDWSTIPAPGGRLQKADVLAHLERQQQGDQVTPAGRGARLMAASPKARRIARELNRDLATIVGTGPQGAVQVSDVFAAAAAVGTREPLAEAVAPVALSGIWRIMAERTTQSWRDVPHFFLLREVNASRLMAWREQAQRHFAARITYTDLLVKVAAATLRAHPRLNASWHEGTVMPHAEVNIGLAVAIEDGLVVPVIHSADRLSLGEIAERRVEMVGRAQSGRLRPEDVSGGTFTISNLGMYGVDAFNAIIHAPQAGILAVGRIADRVVPLHGVPSVQPIMALSLSCDHRVVDGARGAQFLGALADLIEEPLALLE